MTSLLASAGAFKRMFCKSLDSERIEHSIFKQITGVRQHTCAGSGSALTVRTESRAAFGFLDVLGIAAHADDSVVDGTVGIFHRSL